MEKISKALCLGEKSGDPKKNREIAISKKLQNWKPPPYSVSKEIPSTVISVKKKISVGEGYATFPLLSDNLSRKLRKNFNFLTIFAIQVSLKPTKLGSNASAIVCIRNRRSQKFDESVYGLVESSLNDGPIYFFYNPNHSVCLSDLDVSSSFTIDISTTGLHEDENLLLMYSFKYQVMNSKYSFPSSDHEDDDARRKTTLFLTNVAESNRVVSREVCWDEVALPEKWMAEFGLLRPAGETVAKALVGWKETPEAHVFEVDVPGLKRRDVMVEVEDGRILQISGERSREVEEGCKWLCEERSSGKFLRRFRLPVDTEMEQMTVEVENGVLTVTVPKENYKMSERYSRSGFYVFDGVD